MKNKLLLNPKIQLIFVLIFFLIGKIIISGIGYLSDSDEAIYIYVYRNYELLKSGDIMSWWNIMEQTDPLIESFLRFLQTYIAKILLHSIKPNYNIYDVVYLLGGFNIIVSLGILAVFYKILKNLNFNNTISIFGVILLGVFVNYNIYIRHMLPYENGFLANLISLMFLTSKNISYKKILISGVFFAIALNTYYGYFMFLFINTSLIIYLFHSNFREFKNILFLFFTPLIISVYCIELIMQSVDKSYLEFLISSSTTINQGSFSEGIAYIAVYFYFVENWYGIIILTLSFAGVYKLFSNKAFHKASFVSLIGIISYFLYGFSVYYTHSMVFYGRVLHMYYPFIIIICLLFIQELNIRIRTFFIFSLITIAILNYIFVINDLNKIAYPINVVIDYKLNPKSENFTLVSEIERLDDINNIDYFNIYNGKPTLLDTTKKYILLNFGFFHHHPDKFINKYQKFYIQPNMKLKFSKKHFMSHPVYTFEYCTQRGRKFFIDKSLKVSILEIDDKNMGIQ